ncbi:MAG: hypothetical protein ACREHD_05000 [Pirellulales bacterium]
MPAIFFVGAAHGRNFPNVASAWQVASINVLRHDGLQLRTYKLL